jgi:hypothetical protein
MRSPKADAQCDATEKEELAMSVSGETKQDSSLAGRLARQWRDWRWRRRAITELSCCEARDRERIAHDIGISGADLCILAGKWPDDSALLSITKSINANRIQRATMRSSHQNENDLNLSQAANLQIM